MMQLLIHKIANNRIDYIRHCVRYQIRSQVYNQVESDIIGRVSAKIIMLITSELNFLKIKTAWLL